MVAEPEPEPEPYVEPEPEPYEPVEDLDVLDEESDLDLTPSYREPLPEAPKESSGGTGLIVTGAVGIGLSAGAMAFASYSANAAQAATSKTQYDSARQAAVMSEGAGWALGGLGVALVGTGAVVKAVN